MADFWKWFTEKEKACQPMIDWLNENATEIASGWHLWHSGGGCTHYRAEGEFDGKKCEFLLCHESTAEPEPLQDDPLWALTANEVDDQGEVLGFTILAENERDMREVVGKARGAKPEAATWSPL